MAFPWFFQGFPWFFLGFLWFFQGFLWFFLAVWEKGVGGVVFGVIFGFNGLMFKKTIVLCLYFFRIFGVIFGFALG